MPDTIDDILAGTTGKAPQRRGDASDSIRRIFDEEGANSSLGLAMARQEGGKWDTRTSGAGAQGPLQVIPATGLRYVKPDEWNTPEGKIRASARYIKDLSSQFGDDPYYITAAYHAGEGKVKPYYEKGQPVPRAPEFYDKHANIYTPDHVNRVMNNLQGQGKKTVYGGNTIDDILAQMPAAPQQPDSGIAVGHQQSLPPTLAPKITPAPSNKRYQVPAQYMGPEPATDADRANKGNWSRPYETNFDPNAAAAPNDLPAGIAVGHNQGYVPPPATPATWAETGKATLKEGASRLLRTFGNLAIPDNTPFADLTPSEKLVRGTQNQYSQESQEVYRRSSMPQKITQKVGSGVIGAVPPIVATAAGVPAPLAFGGSVAAENLDLGYQKAATEGLKAGLTVGLMQKAQPLIAPLSEGIKQSIATRLVAGGLVGTGAAAMQIVDNVFTDGKVDLARAAEYGIPAAVITSLLPGNPAYKPQQGEYVGNVNEGAPPSTAMARSNVVEEGYQGAPGAPLRRNNLLQPGLRPQGVSPFEPPTAEPPASPYSGPPTGPRLLPPGGSAPRPNIEPTAPTAEIPSNPIWAGDEVGINGTTVKITSADSMVVRGIDTASGQPRFWPKQVFEKLSGRSVAATTEAAPPKPIDVATERIQQAQGMPEQVTPAAPIARVNPDVQPPPTEQPNISSLLPPVGRVGARPPAASVPPVTPSTTQIIPPFAPQSPAKEPWQMTKAEYEQRQSPAARRQSPAEHRNLVLAALLDGKPVPDQVLNDYPVIKTQAQGMSARKSPTAPAPKQSKKADTQLQDIISAASESEQSMLAGIKRTEATVPERLRGVPENYWSPEVKEQVRQAREAYDANLGRSPSAPVGAAPPINAEGNQAAPTPTIHDILHPTAEQPAISPAPAKRGKEKRGETAGAVPTIHDVLNPPTVTPQSQQDKIIQNNVPVSTSPSSAKESDLTDAGWNKKDLATYTHADGRTLRREGGKWVLSGEKMRGGKLRKPKKYATLKDAIADLAPSAKPAQVAPQAESPIQPAKTATPAAPQEERVTIAPSPITEPEFRPEPGVPMKYHPVKSPITPGKYVMADEAGSRYGTAGTFEEIADRANRENRRLIEANQSRLRGIVEDAGEKIADAEKRLQKASPRERVKIEKEIASLKRNRQEVEARITPAQAEPQQEAKSPAAEPTPKQESPKETAPAKAAPTSLVAKHVDLFDRVEAGEATAAEFKAAFEELLANKDAIKAELSALTKDAIFEKFPGLRWRYKSDKKDRVVSAAYDDMLSDFSLSNSVSYVRGQGSYEQAVRNLVAKVTDESLAAHAEKIKNARAERQKDRESALEGMKDPQTLDDYTRILKSKMSAGASYQEARTSLTPEQRAKFDDLAGGKSRDERRARADQQRTEVRAASQSMTGQVIETRHTKTGEPLFAVKTAERVERDVYNQWNATAKRLGGWYSRFRGAGAVPGFQFKTRDNAEAFLEYLGGKVEKAKEAVEARRDAMQDDKSQTAVERLREMADSLDEQADDALSAERQTNTERRARFAANAEAAANADKAMAATMRNIAEAIEGGKAKFLDRVRQKVQVEMLQNFVRSGYDDYLRAEYPTYGEQEKHRAATPPIEAADYAQFPAYTAYRSDLAKLGRQLSENEGTKKLGASILKVADDVTDAYVKFAKENLHKVSTFTRKDGKAAIFASKAQAEIAIARSGYKGQAIVLPFKRGENVIILSPSAAREKGIWEGDNDKRITLNPEIGDELVEKLKRQRRREFDIPWVFESALERRKRLAGMGIETPAELRAALREFIGLRKAPKAPDKIKEMERAMVGRRSDGLDFFPTPAGVADEMIATADIQEGMSVLEPSAGMGHIADRLREAGFQPDVMEFSSDRRDLLKAKGYYVVGSDFMDLSPRGFTYGDVFKYKDGRTGIMRGSGGMGSSRVGFIPEGKEDRQREWVDREDLTGVRKMGSGSGYDRILMNPPFSDRRDVEHVQHAYELLKPGGRMVAIMGEGSFFGSDKKAAAFREWLESVGGTSEKLEEGTFLDPSLPVNTGVNARMVVIDKSETAAPVQPSVEVTAPPAAQKTIAPAVEARTMPKEKTNEATAKTTETAQPAEASRGSILEPVKASGRVARGAESTLSIPRTNQKLAIRYEVRELGDIQPSHNPFSFEKNPDYRLSNDRNYTSPANRMDVEEASKAGVFEPRLLLTDDPTATNGPPVIYEGGDVLGGNSRTMMLARVYRNHPIEAQKYRAGIVGRAAMFGIDPSALKRFDQPVLVRVVDAKPESLQKLITDLNVQPGKAMTATETAAARAKSLPPQTMQFIADRLNLEGPDGTLAEALNGAKGVAVLNRLITDEVIPSGERNRYLTEQGVLTPQARAEIESMLLGRLFEDADQMKATPPTIKNKLARVAPQLAKVAGTGWDITNLLPKAIRAVSAAKNSQVELEMLNRRGSLFGDMEQYTPEELAIARAIENLGPRQIANKFGQYVTGFEESNKGYGLFGSPPSSKEVFDDVFQPARKNGPEFAKTPAAPKGWERADAAAPPERVAHRWNNAPINEHTASMGELLDGMRSRIVPPNRDRHLPVLHGNRATTAILNGAMSEIYGRTIDVQGVNLSTTHAGELMRRLSTIAQFLGPRSANRAANVFELMGRIQLAQQQAKALGYDSIQYVDADDTRDNHRVTTTEQHEITHAEQRKIGGQDQIVSDDWAKKDPDFRQLSKALRNYGGSPRDVAVEAIAHIASGDYELMGYTGKDGLKRAASFARRYFEEVGRLHGAWAIKQFRYMRPEFRQAAKEAAERYEQREREEKQPEIRQYGDGRESSLRIPVRQPTTERSRTGRTEQSIQTGGAGSPGARPALTRDGAEGRGRLPEGRIGSDAGSDRTALAVRQETLPDFSQRDFWGVGEAKSAVDTFGKWSRESLRDVRSVVNPMGRGLSGEQTASITRERAAEMARKGDQADEKLKEARRILGKLPEMNRRAFVYAIETGETDKLPLQYQGFAATIRELLDGRRDEVQSLGSGKLQTFYENYFPHIWKDPEKANQAFMSYFAKRPFEGSKSFLKQRTIPTIEHGIALGLEPVSTNPVDLVMLKLREMDRYIMAHRIMDEMKDNGLLTRIKATHRVPPGYAKLDDKVGTIYGGGAPYSTSRKFHSLSWTRHADGKFSLSGDAERGKNVIIAEKIEPDKLPKYIGKRLAARILAMGPTGELRDVSFSVQFTHYAKEPGSIHIRGFWIAPEPAANVVNNYLSPGLRKFALFRGYLGLANVMNQFQLGISFFHFGFTSLDAAISKAALVLQQLAYGRPLQAAKSALQVPIAPITTILKGRKVYQAWADPGAMGPEWDAIRGLAQRGAAKVQTGKMGDILSGAADLTLAAGKLPFSAAENIFPSLKSGPEWNAIASAGQAGGARLRQDQLYATQMTKKMKEAFAKKNLPGVAGGLFRMPFAAIEQISRPLMEYLVPRQKAGVFAELARLELERLGPDATREDVRKTMAKVWDSVDNRMGQLVYDNLFWNKTFKDVLMGSVRSVGWNLGTKREVIGGAADFVKFGTNVLARIGGRGGGKIPPGGTPPTSYKSGGDWFSGKPEFTYRMGYIIALPIVVGLVGAMINYLMTGERPKDLEDCYFPRTGSFDENGKPNRISLPSYMKDIYHYYIDPGKTAVNKLHPTLNTIAETLSNKDFYGTEVYNPDDPPYEKAKDILKHLGASFEPFAIRGLREDKARQTGAPGWFPFIGLTPAPKSLNQSKAERLMDELSAEHRPLGSRTKEQAEQGKLKADIVRTIRRGGEEEGRKMAQDAIAAGKLSGAQMPQIERRAHTPGIVWSFTSLSLPDALKVWSVATEEEKQALRPALQKKMQSLGKMPEEERNRLLPKARAALGNAP